MRGRMQANEHLIVQLTEPQREVLRLVSEGYKSKEIAHRLGIGVDAVNKRIANAKTVLGAPSRFVAARQLVAVEARSEASHSVVSQILAVGDAAAVGDVDVRPAAEEFVDDRSIQQPEVVSRSPLAAQALQLNQLVRTPSRVFLLMLAVGAAAALISYS
jgi:DNA-binding CsgD family transcriptional regulator